MQQKMIALTPTEQKEVSLEILADVASLCSSYGITYYIAYGTLIGAVRHGGFIPWDDDIDIWVPICDYEGFLDAVRSDTSYVVVDHLHDLDWLKCFSKITDPRTVMKDASGSDMALVPYGVSVDVFPLFGCTRSLMWCRDIENCKRMLAMNAKYRLGQYTKREQFFQRVFVTGLRALGLREDFWRRRIQKLETRYDGSCYLGSPISPYLSKDIHLSESFAETCELEFEGRKFAGPVGWDSILTDLYGDYMCLPPVEKRVSNHQEIAFWV